MIVTLNPCSTKNKACLSKKGGMGVACGVSGAGEQIGRERSEPGRKLRHIVACDNLSQACARAHFVRAPGPPAPDTPQATPIPPLFR